MIEIDVSEDLLNYGTATYLCSKESKNSTPYSASPVEALQELNIVSGAESGSPDETLLPIRRLRSKVWRHKGHVHL